MLTLSLYTTDANSTEFDPDSKHPVVSSWEWKRVDPTRGLDRIKAAAYEYVGFCVVGDRHARAQPRTNGRHNETGEATDHLQEQH